MRSSPPPEDITQLLQAWRDGDGEALERLTPVVYQALRKLAHGYMRQERRDHILRTTGLVHEAFLRLVDLERIDWQSRGHFFAIAARQMRRILIDAARRQHTAKRGGGERPLTLAEIDLAREKPPDLVDLDDALKDLERLDSRKGRVVEMSFFAGMETSEIAGVLEISKTTVERDKRLAMAWLCQYLDGPDTNAS